MIKGSDKINEFPVYFNKLEERVDVLEKQIEEIKKSLANDDV